jgi:WD40 repeat protein/tetratricopeptide (TPR) repeat protein
MWDLTTRQVALTLRGPSDSAAGLAFSPDGRRLASGGSQAFNLKPGTVTVWDTATGQEVLTCRGHTGPVLGVAFSPDGQRLASCGGTRYRPGEVRVWDVVTGQEALTLRGHLGPVQGVAFSPDGRLASCDSINNRVRVWDAATGQEILTLRGRFGPQGVAFSPDGRRLASGAGERSFLGSRGNELAKFGALTVWDAITGQETLSLRGHTSQVHSVAFSPDGKRLASASADGTVRVWDAATGQQERTLKGHTQPVWDVAFSPDGQRLASASDDQTVRVWDAATGQQSFSLKGHTGGSHSVAFSPDGRRLASASMDGTLKVWNATTGQEERTLRGHSSQVHGVAFSPDGKRLASASADKTVKVWDAASGQETLTLRGHTGPVLRVAFDSDGKRLASAGWDGSIRLWSAAEWTPEHQTARLARLEKQAPGWHLEEANSALLEAATKGGMTDAAPAGPLEQARFAERLGQDFAVQFHLKYAARAEDQPAPFYTRRGHFYLRVNQRDKALSDFSRVIELVPLDVGAWRDRANVRVGLGQWAQAVADFSRAIELTPSDGTLWNDRAGTHAPLKQWDQAEADLAKAVELAPEDRWGWHKLARVHLATHNAVGYQVACAALLQRFGHPTDVLHAEDVVWTGVLAPNSGADPAQLLRFAEAAVAQRPKGFGSLDAARNKAILKTLGAALYRAGRYDAAVQRLNEATAVTGRGEPAIDWLFLAMAQHRLGRHDRARESFAKALSLMDEKALAALTWEWRLEWVVVRKEAETLIQPKGP